MSRYPADTEPAAVDALVTGMHTGEFVALRDAVLAEHERRSDRLALVAA